MLFAFAFAFLLCAFLLLRFAFCLCFLLFAFCDSRFRLPPLDSLRFCRRARFSRASSRFASPFPVFSPYGVPFSPWGIGRTVFCIHYFKFRNSSVRISLRGEALLAVRAVPATVSGSLASQIHLGTVLLEEGLKDAEHVLCLVFVFHEFIDSFFFVLAGHIL